MRFKIRANAKPDCSGVAIDENSRAHNASLGLAILSDSRIVAHAGSDKRRASRSLSISALTLIVMLSSPIPSVTGTGFVVPVKLAPLALASKAYRLWTKGR
jgi:hypothetical protein